MAHQHIMTFYVGHYEHHGHEPHHDGHIRHLHDEHVKDLKAAGYHILKTSIESSPDGPT